MGTADLYYETQNFLCFVCFKFSKTTEDTSVKFAMIDYQSGVGVIRNLGLHDDVIIKDIISISYLDKKTVFCSNKSHVPKFPFF